MNCPNCQHTNKAYLDFCEQCHIALDGSGYFEHGFGPKGELPPVSEPRDLPWVFLIASLALWGLGLLLVGLHFAGFANKGSSPASFAWLFALGGVTFAKYLHEKRLRSKR